MTVANSLILVVEDEREICDIIVSYLERAGYRTITANDGQAALIHTKELTPDLIVLDIKLPKLDGTEVLREVRNHSAIPVIIVTAMGEDVERIFGLRLGADDYVVKPFNPLELVERVKAVLRRVQATAAPSGPLRVGPLEVDLEAYAVFVDDGSERTRIELTRTEFELIAHMAASPKRAYTRTALAQACLPESDALDRTIDSHVSNARRKLAAAGASGFLKAVRGVGYRLEPIR